jgi:hypothetical protein
MHDWISVHLRETNPRAHVIHSTAIYWSKTTAIDIHTCQYIFTPIPEAHQTCGGRCSRMHRVTAPFLPARMPQITLLLCLSATVSGTRVRRTAAQTAQLRASASEVLASAHGPTLHADRRLPSLRSGIHYWAKQSLAQRPCVPVRRGPVPVQRQAKTGEHRPCRDPRGRQRRVAPKQPSL